MKQFPFLWRECFTYQEWWHWGILLWCEKCINGNFCKGNFLPSRNGGIKGFFRINIPWHKNTLQSTRVLNVNHNCYKYDKWKKKIRKQQMLVWFFSRDNLFQTFRFLHLLFLWNNIDMNQLFQFNCYCMALLTSFLHVTYPGYEVHFFWLDENVAV